MAMQIISMIGNVTNVTRNTITNVVHRSDLFGLFGILKVETWPLGGVSDMAMKRPFKIMK